MVMSAYIDKRPKRQRKKIYCEAVLNALKKIWFIMNFMCGKRLASILKEAIPILKRHNEIVLGPEVEEKLLKISASTIDRLLKSERRRYELKKGRSHTKPGSLLKRQIQIRTFAEWDEQRPGF